MFRDAFSRRTDAVVLFACVSEREREREREKERERNENGELDEKSGIRPVLTFAKYDTLNYKRPLKYYVV